MRVCNNDRFELRQIIGLDHRILVDGAQVGRVLWDGKTSLWGLTIENGWLFSLSFVNRVYMELSGRDFEEFA